MNGPYVILFHINAMTIGFPFFSSPEEEIRGLDWYKYHFEKAFEMSSCWLDATAVASVMLCQCKNRILLSFCCVCGLPMSVTAGSGHVPIIRAKRDNDAHWGSKDSKTC